MKRLFKKGFMIIIASIAIQSCSNDEPSMAMNYDVETSTCSTSCDQSAFNGNAVIYGVGGKHASEISEALYDLFPYLQSGVDDQTSLVIVPQLSEAYGAALEKVYNNGGIIAVVNPTQNNIDEWYDAYGWEECNASDINGSMIFSFGNGNHFCKVSSPKFDSIESADDMSATDQVEGGSDFESSLDHDHHPKMYSYLHSWIDIMNSDLFNSTATRNSADPTDVSNLFQSYHYSISEPFSANKGIRKLILSDTDYISGEGSVSASFEIYQIHCYEDQPGAGDYYLVNMTASVANENMFKGKWWNRHGGCYVRMCGFFGKSFEVECTPVNSSGNALGIEDVQFIASGFPSPATTVGMTSYQQSSTFNIGVGASISAGAKAGSSGSTPSAEATKELSGNVSAGWSWTTGEQRNISDTDISNQSYKNVVKYKLTFNNLPYFHWADDKGFNIGNSKSFCSTAEIHASWIWYVPNAQDNSNAAPISIRVKAKPTYGAMSFISTEADLKHDEFSDIGNIDRIITLKNFSRKQCGYLVVNNDFSNTIVKEIKVYKESDMDSPVWTSKVTLKPGDSKQSPALSIHDKYNVFVVTKDNVIYKYNAHKLLELEQGEKYNIYTDSDFMQAE